MKIKLNQRMQDAFGKEVIIRNRPPMSLKDIIIDSLLTMRRNPVTGEPEQEEEKKKAMKYELFRKIREKKQEIDLRAEEVTFIKEQISKSQTPLLQGEAHEMIEGTYKIMDVLVDDVEEYLLSTISELKEQLEKLKKK